MTNRRKPAHRDNLSGTQHNLLVELFILPAKIIMWFQFMFPNGGYASTRQSARHARSPIMTYVYAILFWVALGYGLHIGVVQIMFNNIVELIKGL